MDNVIGSRELGDVVHQIHTIVECFSIIPHIDKDTEITVSSKSTSVT